MSQLFSLKKYEIKVDGNSIQVGCECFDRKEFVQLAKRVAEQVKEEPDRERICKTVGATYDIKIDSYLTIGKYILVRLYKETAYYFNIMCISPGSVGCLWFSEFYRIEELEKKMKLFTSVKNTGIADHVSVNH